MRVLLDECLPKRLKASLTDFEVITVPEAGWGGLPDRSLLELAAEHVDVFITADRTVLTHLPPTSPLGILILVAPTNRLADLLPLVPAIRRALATIQPGHRIRLSTGDPEHGHS